MQRCQRFARLTFSNSEVLTIVVPWCGIQAQSLGMARTYAGIRGHTVRVCKAEHRMSSWLLMRTWRGLTDVCVFQKDGTASASYCSILLEDMPKKADKATIEQIDTDIRWTANSMYLASIDSMLTVLLHFLLAMMHYPDVLRKAQAELDTVVGRGRLPTFKDRPSLPYIDCIFNEVLRWGVPVPMS